MNYQNILTYLNIITILGIFGLLFVYWYRILYILYAFTKEEPLPPTDKKFRYAILIAARNESKVIRALLNSIKQQDYPAELLDVYVIGDGSVLRTAIVFFYLSNEGISLLEN